MRNPGRHIMLLAFLLLPQPVWANILLKTSRSVVAAGDKVQLELILPDDSAVPGTIKVNPPLPVGRIGNNSSVSIVNGKVTKKVSITYLLQTSQPGTITIMPIPVKTSKGVEFSNPLRIVVQKADAGRALEITAVAQPASIVEGQAFELVVRILHGSQMVPRSWAPPEGNGIAPWPGEKDARQSTSIVDRGGIKMEMVEIRRWMLATRPGVLTLAGGTLTVEQTGQQRRRRNTFDPFGMFGARRNQSNRAIPGTRLLVRPLPTPPAHLMFAGLVGNFSTHWKLQQRQANRVTALLTLQGIGSAPALNFDPWIQDGWQMYPDKPEIKRFVDASGRTALRLLLPVTLVPATGSNGTLPAWFDPMQNRWRSIAAPDISPPDHAGTGVQKGLLNAARPGTGERATDQSTNDTQGTPERWWPDWQLSRGYTTAMLGGSAFVLLLMMLPATWWRRKGNWQRLLQQSLRLDNHEQWKELFGRLQQMEDVPPALLRMLSDHLYAPHYESPADSIKAWQEGDAS